MRKIKGSLQVKNEKYYAVINLRDAAGKRKQKWVNLNLPEKGNKKKAKALLEEILTEYNRPQKKLMVTISKKRNPEKFIFERERVVSMPLAEYINLWIESVSVKLQRTTIDGYHKMVSGRISEYFTPRGLTVYDVTGEELNTFYAYLMGCGLSGATCQRYHALIHAAFKYAVKREYIDSNPCDFADRPKAEKYHADYYDKEELSFLLTSTKNDPIYIAILMAAYYGLRRSEVVGLKWSNIDFIGKKISVAHKVVEVITDGNYRPVGQDKMKTQSSNRTLPLIPFIEEELKRLRVHQEQQKGLCRNSYCDEYEDYVCVDNMGRLLRPNYITKQFGELLQKYGLRKIRFHDLRHSCASLLLASGIQMKQIQDWLGHSNYQTTADIYSHLDFKSKENSADVIAGLLVG